MRPATTLNELMAKEGEHQKVLKWKERMRDGHPDDIKFYVVCLLGTKRCSYLKGYDSEGNPEFTYHPSQESMHFKEPKEANKAVVNLPSWAFMFSIVVPIGEDYSYPTYWKPLS